MKWHRAIPGILALTLLFAVPFSARAQEDRLPDMIVDATRLDRNQIDTLVVPGRVVFRFDSSLPNIGAGDFLLEATNEALENGRYPVNQRVQRTNGTSYLRDAGEFLYNPDISMMEAPGWVAYRIRAITDDNGVGDILAEGGKPAVRITSSAPYDRSLGERSRWPQ